MLDMSELVSKELCDVNRKSCEKQFSRYDKRMEILEKGQTELIKISERLTTMMERSYKDHDTDKETIKIQGEIITRLDTLIQKQDTAINDQCSRIATLEKEPKSKYDRFIGFVMAAVISAVISIISKFIFP